jgi:Fe2+ transport system protein FeoA
MKLTEAEINKKYKIINSKKLGRKLRNRLADLGIIGGDFIIKNKIAYGPFAIEAKGTRFAIGRGIIEKLEVEEVNGVYSV